MPCCQQQYQSGGKSGGYEKNLYIFYYDYLTAKFLCLQLHHHRTVLANGDISTPSMNFKPPSSMPCHWQHYWSKVNSTGEEKIFLFFTTIIWLLIFYCFNDIITGQPMQWGYLHL
jgi:hypothetical protein